MDKENLNSDKTNMSKKLKNILGNYIGYLAVAIIVIAFFIIGVIAPVKKSDDIWGILCSSALLLFLGISITTALIYQASLDGEKNEKVIKARTQVNIAYNGIKDNTQYIDVYVMHKNITAQKEVITNYLKAENLDYNNHFNSNGTFKYDSFLKINDSDSDFVKKDKEAKNNLLEKLANGINISTISRADVLCQDEVINTDPLKRPRTEKQFMATETSKTIVTKVFSAILGGCYGATFIGVSWGEMLYKLLWAIILIAFAIISYMKTYRYKTVEYVARLNQSATWMDEFGNMVKSKDLEKLKQEYEILYYPQETENFNTDNNFSEVNNIPNNNSINKEKENLELEN